MDKTYGKIAEALSKAQGVMEGAKKDKANPFFKSTYADLASVFEAIRVPFAENGLSISQVIDVKDGVQVLKTLLLHTSGEYLESCMLLPQLAKPQDTGSLISYYRRYSLMAICGVPAEDDDGNKANKAAEKQEEKDRQPITSEQWEVLDNCISDNEALRKNMSQYVKASYGVDLKFMPKKVYEALLERAQKEHTQQ